MLEQTEKQPSFSGWDRKTQKVHWWCERIGVWKNWLFFQRTRKWAKTKRTGVKRLIWWINRWNENSTWQRWRCPKCKNKRAIGHLPTVKRIEF